MSGIISITSRRLPRNVLSLGMQAARSQEVKSANVVRHYARLATVQAQLIGDSQTAITVRPLGVMTSQSFHTSVSLWNVETIKVPPFADSVSEGDVKFTCNIGDYVKVDQTVMEIETDKTTVGVPAPFGGIIKEILVSDGDTVKAGQPLFKLEKADASAAPAAAPKADAPATPPPAAAAPPPPAAKPAAAAPPPPKPAAPRPPPPPPTAPVSSIPSASIPRAPGIVPPQVKVPPADYSRQITGTRTEQRVKMNRMRLKIAARLKEAQNVNAMLTTFNEIDMSGAMAFRKENLEAFQKKYGLKIGFMSIFTKASAYALQDQPVVNAVIDGAEIIYRDYVDISVAVATPKGLVVPVIRNVESMNYADIEIAMAALGDKARKGAIAVEDMDGGTFTISNGGVFGSLMGTPIINPPQSAILGMHGIFERPVAIKGQVVIRPMMYVALTYDHRLIDGREAVMFLRKIKAAVEDPRIILAGLFTCNIGDYVKVDQTVMEIETDKTTVGVPAPFGGIIKEILVSDGDTVKAGQPLFKLEKADASAAPAAAPKADAPATPPPAAAAPPPPAAKPAAAAPPPPKPAAPRPPPPPPTAPVSSIPSASIPRAPGIVPPQVKVPPADYSRQITGTRTEQRVKMNRMRLKIAARLKEAQNVNAMLTTFNEIDMSGAMAFRKENLEAFQKKYGLKIGFMSIFTKASAYALQDQPVVNAVIDGAEIIYRDYVDISVAVATPKGLVVPVIRNVESMNYADIEIAMAALGDKARKGAIAVEDMDGGTFTISNGGVFGSLMGTPIINPPQSAILGMHGIFERPVAIKGQVVIRPMMYVALTYDHRLIDGREAVMFLRKIKAAVEDPRIILAGL